MRAWVSLCLPAVLAACVPAVTVRAPTCELPPLPPAALAPCTPLKPIADGRLETLFLEHFVTAAAYADCLSKLDNLKAQIATRDAKIRECQQIGQPSDKPWWKP